jgi:hypothetical protein
MELNLILGGVSFTGKLAGYDRIHVGEGDANFGELKNAPGIRGFLDNGFIGLPMDVIDTALTYQGLPTAQGLSLAMSCGGRVNGACLGGGYQGALYGHSLGAAEVSVMKGLGLVDKSVGIKVFSLPITRIAPGGVSVYQGSRDIVNLGWLGHITNIGSNIVDQSGSPLFSFLNNHKCFPGYSGVGCGE